MEVIALDTSFGGQQRYSSALVNITIVDVNNKPPTFLDTGSVIVPEDAPNQSFVSRVVAIDLDEKPVLRYSIDWASSEARNENGIIVRSGLFKDSFSINQLDGTIRVAKPLDRETWEELRLALLVEDIAATQRGQIAKCECKKVTC